MKNSTRSRPKTHGGFTLIELLVVITIIVVLLALLVPAMDKAIYQAELAACGANLKSIAGGAVIYAMDHKRWYLHRPGVFSSGDGYWQADELQDDTGIDDRPKYKGYIEMKMLVDPLCQKVDLSPPVAPANTYVISSYNLRFGYKFFPPNGKATTGMFRLGQRLGWSDTTGDYSFNVLASDQDRTASPNAFVISSHPDTENAMAPQVLQQNAGTMLSPAFNLSRWGVFGRHERGTVDLNFVFDDTSVARYDKMHWNDYQVNERMVRVANYNRSAADVEWHHMPLN